MAAGKQGTSGAQKKMTEQAGKPGQGRGGNASSRFPDTKTQKPAGKTTKGGK